MAPQERDGLSIGSDLELDKRLHLYFNCQKSQIGTSIKYSLSTAMHMNEHYVHKCPHCTYTSKTEGRLKRHEKEFHSATPPESWVGKRSSKKDTLNSDQSGDSSVKSSYKKACKKCEFVAYKESEYWIHKKIHLKPEKILQCPQCEFCTDLKQHYDYHIRIHTGSKPFKCKECNYECVNKSMLNSHLKSHSSVYPFGCQDCSYETKYYHIIKEHLKKYNHRPRTVLNQDGTPCPDIVIDVYGKKRGPRANKRKFLKSSENNYDNTFASSGQAPTTIPSNQGLAFPTAVPLVQQNNPILNSNVLNFQRDLFRRSNAEINNCNFSLTTDLKKFRCRLCTFVTGHQEMFIKHFSRHMAPENADIEKVYGNNLELMRAQEMAINGDTNGVYNFPETEQYQRVPSDYSAINESHNFKQVYNERMADVKYEEKNSRKFRRISVQKYSDKNNSPKGFSSPSPPGSSNYSSEIEIFMDKSSADRSSPDFVPEVNRMEDNESPIDLSGRSSSDSIKTNRSSKNMEGPLKSTNQIISICAPLNRSFASQRNLRKGKPYKIDQYLQYNDQSLLYEETVVTKTQESIDDTSKCTLAKANEGIEPIAMLSNKNFQKASKINHCTLHDNPSSLAEEKEMFNNIDLNPLQKGAMLSEKNEKDQLFDDYSKFHKCVHCGILFESLIMYKIHNGYHTLENPFCCNSCGHISKDREEFYAHMLKCN